MKVLMIQNDQFTYSENNKIRVFTEAGKEWASFSNINLLFKVEKI